MADGTAAATAASRSMGETAAWLADWVRPEHLLASTAERCRAEFEASPFRVATLSNFLRDDVADALGRFLAAEVPVDERYMLYGTRENPDTYGMVSGERWHEAPADIRLSRFGIMRGLPIEAPSAFLMAMRLREEVGCRLTPDLLTFLRFYIAFSNPRFTALWQGMTGLELGESNLHQVNVMRAGDFIGPHDDYFDNRRLTVLLYIAPGWTESHGGTLRFVARDGSTAAVSVEHNKLVVFEVSREIKHLVETVEPAAGDRRRITIGGSVDAPPQMG